MRKGSWDKLFIFLALLVCVFELQKRIDLLAAEMQKAIDDHKNNIQSEEDEKIAIQARKLRMKGSKHRTRKQERLLKVIP